MRDLRDYGVVTGAYWAFTLTDGALRMLVLLHLHTQGFTPLQLAALFLGYEFFGVATNLTGGWLGARVGLTRCLQLGLVLQVLAIGVLDWQANALTVPLVVGAQALSGVAKDLTKMSSKSYVKLVVAEGDASGLMRWVAILTGSKNTLKGVGFFLGAAALAAVGFRGACHIMIVGLLVSLGPSLLLPARAGKAKSSLPFRSVFSKDPRINWLSLARFFLFGSRDAWFVIGLPLFLAEALSWDFHEVGGFMALWVIGYGFVQASAPKFTGARGETGRHPPDAGRMAWITGLLLLPLGGLLVGLHTDAPADVTVIVGLALFGAVFAACSAVHSYLVVHYADGEKVSLAVGFYYTANAAGRLIGTAISGAAYQFAGAGRSGLVACLASACVLVVASWIVCGPLVRAERRVEAGDIG